MISEKVQNLILDAGVATATTGTIQDMTLGDPNTTAIIAGIFAPIIKEALFRLIDKIGTLRKQRKARKNGTD